MVRLRRSVPAVVGWSSIVALGGFYLTFAAGQAFVRITGDARFENELIVFVLIAGPGFVLLYGGYWLTRTDIPPDFYPVIAGWCLGGLGVMLVLLMLYELQPTDGLTNPRQSIPILTSLGSVAGYGVGIYNAQTKELQRTQEELAETVDRLQTSNERLEQFAYAASHDLQEPLRMVSGYLLLLDRRCGDDLDEEGTEYLGIAVDSADRMREMVDGLLRYSRVASDGEQFEPVDLDTVLTDVRNDLRMQIEEHNTEVTAGSLPYVEGDEDQIYQVFQNLLKNAIQYSGKEPPRVYVSAERNGTEWTITVRDEGIGIDPEDADSIFELFQRGPDREDYNGSGIGLALCEQIIERHGGEIWVDSEPSEGSAFSFTLPAAPEGDHDG